MNIHPCPGSTCQSHAPPTWSPFFGPVEVAGYQLRAVVERIEGFSFRDRQVPLLEDVNPSSSAEARPFSASSDPPWLQLGAGRPLPDPQQYARNLDMCTVGRVGIAPLFDLRV